jgi:hypothetical protein
MLKLSITLPNNVLITLESDNSEPVHEVLALILSSVQMDSRLNSEAQTGVDANRENTSEKSNGVPGSRTSQSRVPTAEFSNGLDRDERPDTIPEPAYEASLNGWNGHTQGEVGDNTLDLGRYHPQAREDFVAFCQAINPTGDMRRVVVAAEAANRFFDLEGVTADEVGELFDVIGWRRANNFTHTIRNAARSKFGWLERIPGRAGRYAATDVGRSTTLSG